MAAVLKTARSSQLLVGSNPTPSAPPPARADTPRRDLADGMTGRSVTVFPQVNSPHVDMTPSREAGHHPLITPVTTIR
jgi:hypothetical protein